MAHLIDFFSTLGPKYLNKGLSVFGVFDGLEGEINHLDFEAEVFTSVIEKVAVILVSVFDVVFLGYGNV